MGSSKRIFLFLSLVHLFGAHFRSGSGSGSEPEFAELLRRAKEPEFVERMVSIRRKIHENPELGYEELETSKLIREELDRVGIRYEHPIAVTGVKGFVGSGNPPFVGLRADMDALALQENVEWEHKSKVLGKMHACGHDGHVAALLGAAKILQEHRDALKGTVVLLFQPAEEGGAGAKKMTEAGAVNDIDAMFGFHLSIDVPIGAVAGRPGPILAGSGFFEAVISGKGGHAALPQHTVDPILAASNVIASLQHLVSREADPLDSQVVTISKFEGGSAFNVIPDSVTIGGTFRAFSKESFNQLKQRIEEVIVGQASVQRCRATVDFLAEKKPFVPVTINSETLHGHFVKVAGEMLGSENVRDGPQRMGTEDFSFYADVVPETYFYFVGMKNKSEGPLHPGHSPHYRMNERALSYGAALQAYLAVSYLSKIGSGTPSAKEVSHYEL